MTSDTVEFDTKGEMTVRSGETHFDSVEFYNCSQIDTPKAAVRFESAIDKWSSVSNSALHNGYSWAVAITTSRNILIKDNVIFNFRPIGVNIGGSSNITIDGNAIGLI